MKKALIMAFALVFASQTGVLFAGDKGDKAGCKMCAKDGVECSPRHHKAKWQEKRLERMTKQLGLTPEQKEKISAIFKENDDKIAAEAQKTKETVKTIMQDTDKQVTAALTPGQAKKYVEMKEERKAKAGKMRHHMKDGKRMKGEAK